MEHIDIIKKALHSCKERKNMNNTSKIVIAIIVIAIIVAGVFGYTYISQPANGNETISLNGAGATFPVPLLDAMVKEYEDNVKSNVLISYEGIGSGGGISALQAKTVDFAGSDAPMSAAEMAEAPNTLHIPETIGAVTVAYNIPDVATGLHLTGQIIADIFQGKITNWNDAAIQDINPDVTLPDHELVVAHRSDGSGTTFIFTGYLSVVSTDWEQALGQGKTVEWPVGLASPGNSGVAGIVQGTEYSIGYVELAYALENNMAVAAIQNPAGNFVAPSLDSTTEAVSSKASQGLPAGDESWFNVNVLNAPGEQAYPIVSFTYILVYKELNVINGMTESKATALVQFLWWMVHDGQQLGPALEYASLPSNVVSIDEASIQSITFKGQQLPTS
jgi:phosphate transport system substrate-binding protein